MLMLANVIFASLFITVGVMMQHSFPNLFDKCLDVLVDIKCWIILPFLALKLGWNKAGKQLINENMDKYGKY